MARQIVPVSDVASILLTQDEGDLRYLPLSYVPPATDLSNYWTKAQADGRYEPIDTMYTKAESDAKYLTQALGDARYSLTTHLHTGVYQPVGSYSLTSHEHDAAYVNVTGDSMSAPLFVQAPVRTTWTGGGFLHFGGYGMLTSDLVHGGAPITIYANTYRSMPSGAEIAIGVGTGGRYIMSSGQHQWANAPSVAAGAAQTYTNRMILNENGTLFLYPGTNANAITVSGANQAAIALSAGGSQYRGISFQTNGVGRWGLYADYGAYQAETGGNAGSTLRLSRNADDGAHIGDTWLVWRSNGMTQFNSDAGAAPLALYSGGNMGLVFEPGGGGSNARVRVTNGNLEMAASGGYWHPQTDNALYLGYVNLRFIYVAAVQGTINTCHAEAKKGFKPLDPLSCTNAVLETDWLSYEYLPPPPPERKEGESNQERMAVLDEYVQVQEKNAFARKQNGYVLGHPTHKTHDLFGLADRQSASPSADLGILACALQAALKRIAALEGVPSE